MTDFSGNAIVRRVQDGTTFGGSDMCASCRYALRRRGSITGFIETRCGFINNHPIVPARIASCTGYLEKGRMTLGEMIDSAWVIETKGKHIGFLSPEDLERRRNGVPFQKPQNPIGF